VEKYKYKKSASTDGGITKDGHTMFAIDTVKDIEYMQDRITALEAKLKAAEEKMALSVPFEVVQRKFRKCGDCGFNSEYCMKVNCPIIPKAKTDE
jgi:hypothetical protein